MKANGEMEVERPSFLNSTPNGGEWPYSCPSRFICRWSNIYCTLKGMLRALHRLSRRSAEEKKFLSSLEIELQPCKYRDLQTLHL
jgi:hypothetical protein